MLAAMRRASSRVSSLKLSVGSGVEKLSFALRLPLARQLLRFGDLLRGLFRGDQVAVVYRAVTEFFLRTCKSRGCKVEPHMRLHVILRHALAHPIHETEGCARPIQDQRYVVGRSHSKQA
jgi:hypothetical protein